MTTAAAPTRAFPSLTATSAPMAATRTAMRAWLRRSRQWGDGGAGSAAAAVRLPRSFHHLATSPTPSADSGRGSFVACAASGRGGSGGDAGDVLRHSFATNGSTMARRELSSLPAKNQPTRARTSGRESRGTSANSSWEEKRRELRRHMNEGREGVGTGDSVRGWPGKGNVVKKGSPVAGHRLKMRAPNGAHQPVSPLNGLSHSKVPTESLHSPSPPMASDPDGVRPSGGSYVESALQLPSVSSDNGEKELVEVEVGGQQETTPSPFPSTVNPFPFWLLKSLSGRREASAETEGREEVVGEGGNGTSVAAAEKEARGVGEEKEAEERIEGGEEAGGRPVFKGIDYERLERDSELLRNVHVVRDKTEAERVAALLMSPKYGDYVFACDTEVAHIDVKTQSPVGHGQVICFSVHGGPDIHFGESSALDADTEKTMLWVDTYGIHDLEEVAGVFDAFKPFFADASRKKVWHNFSFDRHVLNNHGIECNGLAGDTMHMARMFDASRLQGGGSGYSLEALSSDKDIMKEFGNVEAKTGMKKLFERPVIKKDGTPGKLTVLPPMEELQLDPDTRAKWIYYSALDAKSTWQLFKALENHLKNMDCYPNSFSLPGHIESMWALYKEYWLPFGQLLTDMEAAGVLVNREHLAAAEVEARKDQESALRRFKGWAAEYVPDAELMNVSSGPQVRQLFFAGQKNEKTDEHLELEKAFKIPNEDPNYIEEGAKRWKKNRDITLWSVFGRDKPSTLEVNHYTPSGWPATGTPALRALAGKPQAALKALAKMGVEEDTKKVPLVGSFDEEGDEAGGGEGGGEGGGAAKRAKESIQALADAKKFGYGSMYAAFEAGEAGLRACAAVDALLEVNAIDTLLSNFILPLQGDDIATADHRVHCSLNINTETGRLSARRPNLQNQPALEKDRYKIRKAFTADVAAGNTLIVADYGQLELRLLAHMAKCVSMREAFELGGDFHSRTAFGMYDYIQAAVARGECLLEWDYPNGDPPPVPLVKDKFGSERRKAKVLNFSIAYGKTAHGLMKDFGTDLQEAQETVDRWYADRKEVKEWQEQQRDFAKKEGFVTTLLGRRRKLPGIKDGSHMARGHAQRAAINTPIQGAAADVATAAMISIARCQKLKDLRWTLLLQVHDEVILEGPKETAEEAQRLVLECMERPFDGQNPLTVDLNVDSNIADTWYEAK